MVAVSLCSVKAGSYHQCEQISNHNKGTKDELEAEGMLAEAAAKAPWSMRKSLSHEKPCSISGFDVGRAAEHAAYILFCRMVVQTLKSCGRLDWMLHY